MSHLESTQSAMERITGAAQLGWPDENVIRVLRRSFDESRFDRVPRLRGLDIGFGSGRHLRAMADEGFDVCGLDYAQSAHDRARGFLASFGIEADLRKEELSQTSFEPESFDLVVAWGALFTKPMDEIVADLHTVARLMRDDAVLCCDFRTTNNWFYGLGREVCPNGFQLDDRAGAYTGCFYQFMDEPQLRGCIDASPFAIEACGYHEWRSFEGQTHSWWVPVLRKTAG